MPSEKSTDSERQDRLAEIVLGYLKAMDAGDTPDQQGLLARHPDLADELKAFFTDQARCDILAAPLRLPAPAPPEDAVPSSFGDYEVLTEIARGGMGVVYKARQISLKRVVALKMILRGELATPDAVQRFRTEAEAAAQLEHPHIVPIYEVGEHHGQHFFAMKLVEGVSLAQRKADLRLNAAMRDRTEFHRRQGEIGRLLALVARAVHFAHQRGILHRDLKPANILLEERAERVNPPVPLVTDFGLAKRLEGDSGLTQSGAIVGTPSYMAPEQAAGAKVLTTATDVYGLGAILYELLTGQPPFKGETILDTLRRVQEGALVRPRALVSRIDRDLETICLKCLEVDPGRRYPSAAAVAEDLEAWRAGVPIQARRAAAWEQTAKWVKRRPAVAGLLGVSFLAVLALVGGLVSLSYGTRLEASLQQEQIQRSEADRQRQEAEQQQGEAIRQRQRAEQQQGEAVRQRQRAEKLGDQANQLRIRAEQSEVLVRRLLYCADMRQAGNAWNDGMIADMDALLERQRLSPDRKEDLRGFEWHYLRRLGKTASHTIHTRTRQVYSVAMSPDGNLLASGGDSPVVEVWNRATGRTLFTLPHQRRVVVPRFSPDGKWLASADGGATVQLWNVATGKSSHTLEHKNSVRCFAFSPDGQQLASAGNDGILRLWDVTTAQTVRTFQVPGLGAVHTLMFSPDGKSLAVAEGAMVRLFDLGSGQTIRTFRGPSRCFAFSPDGKSMASASDETVRSWDVATGQLLHIYTGHQTSVNRVAFSTDGCFLASASHDRTVKVWYFVTGQPFLTLRGHLEPVTDVAYSPDGKQIVTASLDRTVRFWNAKRDPEALVLSSPSPAGFSAVKFSPDGRRLAASSWSGQIQRVQIWDPATGQELLTFPVPPMVRSIAFSPNGQRLASGYDGDGTVTLWEAATGREILSLKGHTRSVYRVAFSPDGQRLASASWDHTVRFWDTTARQPALPVIQKAETLVAFSPDGRHYVSINGNGLLKLREVATGRDLLIWQAPHEVLSLEATGGGLTCVTFSPDGQRLGVGWGRTVQLWEVTTRRLISCKGNTAGVESLAFSPDGQRLASGGADFTVRIWDTATGQLALTLRGHKHHVRSVDFSPDGQRLASASSDGTVRIWDASPWGGMASETETTLPKVFPEGLGQEIRSVCFFPDGRRALSGILQRRLHSWDVASGRTLRSFVGHTDLVWGVVLSPDGRRALSASSDKTMRLWDVESGKELRRFQHPNLVWSAAFSPDGRTALSADQDQLLRLWDVESGKEVRRFEGHTGPVLSVAFSPDGRRALSGSEDKTVRLWDVETGKQLHCLDKHLHCVLSVAYAPDGKRVLSGGCDTTLRLWDANTGTELRVFRGHTANVESVCFSPDGHQALSASADTTVRLWDVTTGKQLHSFLRHSAGVTSAVFSPDGRQALSGSQDKTLVLWTLPAPPPQKDDKSGQPLGSAARDP